MADRFEVSPELPKPVHVERRLEQAAERPYSGREQAPEQPLVSAPVTPTPQPISPEPVEPGATGLVHDVENILSEGLEETYRRLDPATQARFKQTGETTAGAIAGLLSEARIQVRKILDLLIGWLRIIPGVNQHFLEQEAKIKADKLMRLRRPPV